MAAHRYWRLLVARNYTNARIQLAELELRGAIGGPSVVTGGAILSSGTSAGAPSNVFDGNTATQWDSSLGAGQHWIGYQFPAPVDVLEVSVRTGTDSALLSSGSAFLQHSDDGAQWSLQTPAMGLNTINTTYVVSGFSDLVGISVPSAVPVYRYYWGGPGRIVGTTKIKGTPNTPVRRRVRLLREIDGVCVGERWSDPTTGYYEFLGFDPTTLYTVVVYDGPRVFRAAVQDAVVPEAYNP